MLTILVRVQSRKYLETGKRFISCLNASCIQKNPVLKRKNNIYPCISYKNVHTRSKYKFKVPSGTFAFVFPVGILAFVVWAFLCGGISLHPERVGDSLPLEDTDEIVYVSRVEKLSKERKQRQFAAMNSEGNDPSRKISNL